MTKKRRRKHFQEGNQRGKLKGSANPTPQQTQRQRTSHTTNITPTKPTKKKKHKKKKTKPPIIRRKHRSHVQGQRKLKTAGAHVAKDRVPGRTGVHTGEEQKKGRSDLGYRHINNKPVPKPTYIGGYRSKIRRSSHNRR